jgi:hypothetical protein
MLLSLNDVLNLIPPLLQREDDASASVSLCPFRLFSTTDDSIDLAHNSAWGVQLTIRWYRTMVLTKAAPLGFRASV